MVLFDADNAHFNTIRGFSGLEDRLLKVHSGKYDYSNSIYGGMRRKIDILCKEHGVFKQAPDVHIKGHGCPSCAVHKAKINLRYTEAEFINKANKVHKLRYTYKDTGYINSNSMVDIICNKHGVFTQLASNHIQGHGCPTCSNIVRDTRLFRPYHNRPTMLYYIKITNTAGVSLYKLGITVNDVKTRYQNELAKKYVIETIYTKQFETGKEAFQIEQSLIKLNKKNKYTGGEFLVRGKGDSELFFTPIVINNIGVVV